MERERGERNEKSERKSDREWLYLISWIKMDNLYRRYNDWVSYSAQVYLWWINIVAEGIQECL